MSRSGINRFVLREGEADTVGMDPTRLQHVRELAASWVENGEVPSLAMLVARRGTIVLHEAFGVRRQEDTTATLKRDAIFTIASCSKPITAAAVMCLVEDGLIGLNRPFLDYVPELDVEGVQWLEEVRVADLLCHTSGYDDQAVATFVAAAAERTPDLPRAAPGQHPALNTRIRLAAGAPLARRPGSAMLYSNFAYQLLGDIVRRISDQPLWRFAQLRLFEPLGMRDSYYRFPPELRDRRVYRSPGMPGMAPVPGLHQGFDSREYDELDSGSSGVASTAYDLAVFLQMLLNRGSYGGKRVLSPASVEAMSRHQVDTSIPWIIPLVNPTTGQWMEVQFKGGGYGYGLYIFGPGDTFRSNGSLASTSAFGHMGYASAYVWADSEQDLVAVWLGVVPGLRRGLPATNTDLFMNAVYAAILN